MVKRLFRKPSSEDQDSPLTNWQMTGSVFSRKSEAGSLDSEEPDTVKVRSATWKSEALVNVFFLNTESPTLFSTQVPECQQP